LATEAHAPVRFTVDPLEGTVAGSGGSVRLEPKVMEVLGVLTRHPGRVVSRDELLDAVWPDVVVTEHTLSRCIYQLRHELGKIGGEAGQPDYNPIETLPKRGYRLLAKIDTVSPRDASPSSERSIRMPAIPYVVGQWVRGDRFYGRSDQIAEILEGHRNCLWLLGTRRIGKTSLLKQIEYIASTSADRRYFPVFWDFQGAETPEDLHLNFTDAILDAEERLEGIGIRVDEVEADDLFVSLERLRRRLRAEDLQLLLLCDEVEELIKLHRQNPALLRKLRHAMQSREDIRTVLASTIRLWELAEQKEDTSPFLHGFAPPLYIERLTDAETRALIEQSHLALNDRPSIEGDVVEAIREHCNNHPYLVQLVCKRYLEAGSLEVATEQVATDRMVSYFFSVDFDMLADTEQQIIHAVLGSPEATFYSIREDLALGADALEGSLARLENLGFIRRDEEHRVELANYFFRRWLRQLHDAGKQVEADVARQPAAVEASPPAASTATAGLIEPIGFFAELKRRSVVRVGIAYVLVAWVLLQVGEIVFEFLEVPGWAGKLLIVFLSLGLPVALFLAWAFELTPEGVKLDKNVDRSQVAARPAGRKLDRIIILVLAMAVVFFIVDKFLWGVG